MTHKELDSQAQAMLPNVLREVASLYQGEVLADALVSGGDMEALDPGRDALWRQAAGQFPPFRNRIVGLKLALDNARQAFEREGDVLRGLVESRFTEAEDMGVRHLLTTLLCSRATRAQGIVDETIYLNVEAEAMKRELGVLRGIEGLDLETMTLHRAAEAVLTGELEFSRQT